MQPHLYGKLVVQGALKGLKENCNFKKAKYQILILTFNPSILVPEATLLLVSTKNCDLWPCPTPEVRVTLRMLCVKSDRSDWFWSQSIVYKDIQNQNVVGPDQKSRFLVLTKRSAASGNKNAIHPEEGGTCS